SYAFPVEVGKQYQIDLYFAIPFADRDRAFDVMVEGTVPANFANIAFPAPNTPMVRSAIITANDQWLNLTWQPISGEPLVNGIQITELAADTTPPTVSITSPADGSTVNPPVTITASATDDTAVSSVAFYANGGL